jgi:hypothetical protein
MLAVEAVPEREYPPLAMVESAESVRQGLVSEAPSRVIVR